MGKKNVDENHDKLKVTMENVKKEVTESIEENKDQTRKSVEECMEISEEIVRAKEELKTNSSTFITDSLSNFEDVFHKVEGSLDDRKKDFKTTETNVTSKLGIKQESKIDSNVDDLVALTKANKDDMKENVDV